MRDILEILHGKGTREHGRDDVVGATMEEFRKELGM